MTTKVVGVVRVKSQCSGVLRDNLERIFVLFSARLDEKNSEDQQIDGSAEFDVCITTPADRTVSSDLVNRIQKYVEELCKESCAGSVAGEDSSYDSDYEADPPTKHQDVSRTTSDTLAAEYAEYVHNADLSPGYTARVEFALKLGYTEELVQAALQKLGSSPAQNELLAELIKLGAQRGGYCDNSPIKSLNNVLDVQSDTSISQTHLRPVVIDGSNVAMSHGNKECFSCRGIRICVDWFKVRGHKDITVFVPTWRKESPRPDNPVVDQDILAELERERLLVFTPSRLVGGKRTVCYDDRYILKLAAEIDGIVVSNDNYRDLCQESTEFRKVVEERVLMYSFVNDRFMPPDDPLGRSGPTLDNFLRFHPSRPEPPPPCPYARKCTYGNKCKYHHPERGPLPHKSVTERLSEHAQRHLQAREGDVRSKAPLGRTRSGAPPPKENAVHQTVTKSRSVDSVGVEISGGENLHRKLQRQLTLNPGNDVRNRYSQQLMQASPITSHPHNATSYASNPNWELHQHVTRIASAPDSYRPWPPQVCPQQPHMHRVSSSSDPQLNVWPQWGLSGASSSDTRRKMHYHLAAIFPEEQVTAAMQMYPEETNPQKICAAILSMFPKP